MPVSTSTEVLTPQISKLNGVKFKKLTGQLNGHVNGTGQPTPPVSDLAKSPPADDASLADVKIPHGKGMATFSLKDVLIPNSAGLGLVKKYYQQRTLYQYLGLSASGLYIFAYSEDSKKRTAALGLLFPGAGLTAVATIPSLLAFVLTIALIPLVMLVWFGMGGVFFPLALHFGSAGLAAFLAEDRVFEEAGYLWAGICGTGLLYIYYKSGAASAPGYSKQQARNKYLMKEVANEQANAVPAPPAGFRELDEHCLKFVQHMME